MAPIRPAQDCATFEVDVAKGCERTWGPRPATDGHSAKPSVSHAATRATAGNPFLPILFTLIGCSHYDLPDDVRLVDCNSHLLLHDVPEADGYELDRSKFIEPYAIKRYSGDTLFIRTVHEVNSCGGRTCHLWASNDTLHLSVKGTDDLVCASVEYDIFEYTIVSPRIKQFVVPF